jgi:DNA-binding NarL/FixJ family response regulator
MTVRVLIVERHALFAEALRSALVDAKMDVAGVFSTGRGTIAFLERDQPDVILIDHDLPSSRANLMKRKPTRSDGVAIGRRILTRWPEVRMILMSPWDDLEIVEGALREGFRGYLTKATPIAEFISSIQAVADGETVFPKQLLADDDRPGLHPGLSPLSEAVSDLTEEEKLVFGLLVEGADGRTIARRLGISRGAASAHVKAILRKLNVEGRFDG